MRMNTAYQPNRMTIMANDNYAALRLLLDMDADSARTRRYSRAGMAHSAAEKMTAKTGDKWEAVHRPSSVSDQTPFMIDTVE